ncbi:hypothetical protein J2X61_006704 [Bacillus sp. 3255]|nr:hypothetical protein [Bacillus sp. 3255]
MKWGTAKNYQLAEIAYNDTGCSLEHKMAALDEIRRRKQARANHIAQQTKLRRKRH